MANYATTPEDVAARRRYAMMLMQQGGEPVQHWAQGAGNIVKSLVGGLVERNARGDEARGREEASKALSALLLGGQSGNAGVGAIPPAESNRTANLLLGKTAPPPEPDAWQRSGGMPMQRFTAGNSRFGAGEEPPDLNAWARTGGVPTGQRDGRFATAFGEQMPVPARDAPATSGAPFLTRVAMLESRGNPNARNKDTGAAGVLQFMPETAKAYNLANPFDEKASMEAGTRLDADNTAALTARLGRPPTEAERYLAWQQGGAGASALLTNPNAAAVDVLTQVYGGNRNRAMQAITLNGGRPDMAAGQFADLWRSKYDGTAAASASPQDGRMGAAQGGVGGGGSYRVADGSGGGSVTATGGPGAATGRPGNDVAQLMELASNPWLNEGQRAVINSVLAAKMRESGPGEIKEVNNRLYQIKGGKAVDITPEGARTGFRPLITPEERRAAGLREDDRTPYQIGPDGKISQVGGAGTTVNIDQKNESAEAKTRGELVPKHFAKIAEDLPAADGLLQSVDRLGQLLEGTDTGAVPGILEGIRKSTGIAIGPQADKRQAVESIIDYLTPRMRVPGSGATSDMEMKTFRNSLPTLLGTPGGNKIITETLRGLAERRVTMGQIAEDYLIGQKTAEEATAAMRSLPDPFAPLKAAVGGGAGNARGGAGGASDAPPANVDPNTWKHMTPEERALWRN